jgi:ferredoxin-NADP reductase
MNRITTTNMCPRATIVAICCVAFLTAQLLFASYTLAQVSAADHAKHHPTAAANAAMPASPNVPTSTTMPVTGSSSPPAGMSGMSDMGEMMKGMGGAPPQKEIYPLLMGVPELTQEQRREVEFEGNKRMTAGAAAVGAGLDKLSTALAADDFRTMQEATTQMRNGVAELESGIAAWRALAEGKPPRDVALQWFKTEMSLPQGDSASPAARTSFLHLSIMAALVLFAVAMLWMYFHKMKRATSLLQSLTTGIAPPPLDSNAQAGAPVATDDKVKRVTPTTVSPLSNNLPVSEVALGSGAATGGRTKKWSGKLRISRIFDEAVNVKTFRLMDPLGGDIPFNFQPGQYLTATVLPEGKPVKRSYTIASSPSERVYVDLTIKREERGVESRHFHDHVQTGDLLDFSGPFGAFVFTGRECKCLVFIAAGVGITPLMSVTRYLTDGSWPGDIYLIYSCHSPQDLIFKEELDFRSRRHPNLHVVVTVTNAEGTDWKGPTGRITKELISQAVPNITSRRVHICGPTAMMDATKSFLSELGVPKEQIKTEAFAPAIGKTEPEGNPADTFTAAPAAASSADRTTGNVLFSTSGKSAPLPPQKTVLEASEDIGVNIPFECRVGTCGECKVKLISGQVTMAIQESLTPEDNAGGIILACQAKSTGNITVEA